jgi:hypothetical protein
MPIFVSYVVDLDKLFVSIAVVDILRMTDLVWAPDHPSKIHQWSATTTNTAVIKLV